MKRIMFFAIVSVVGMIAMSGCEKDEQSNLLNGHEWVDLGLYSGTKWATCNIGANTPEESGDYFAWGETTTKRTYNWTTYHYCKGDNKSITKYCCDPRYGNNGFTDNRTILEASDDVATVNWGTGWRMPTKDEMIELITMCTTSWTVINGVSGRVFVGPNGNSIFLPASGEYYESEICYAGLGHYWSSSLCGGFSNDAWYLYLNSKYFDTNYGGREYGYPIRPVCNE